MEDFCFLPYRHRRACNMNYGIKGNTREGEEMVKKSVSQWFLINEGDTPLLTT